MRWIGWTSRPGAKRFNEAEARTPRMQRERLALASHRDACFNEAEARTPRMHGRGGRHHFVSLRFNEAEARTPRMLSIHDIDPDGVIVLQ